MIDLVYPDAALSPNSRTHWRRKAAVALRHRKWARIATVAAREKAPPLGPVSILLTFYPPTKRRRDADNALASLKPALDGVADALGIDDSRFVPTVRFADPDGRSRVEVEIREADGR